SLSDYYCLPNKLFEYAFSEVYVLASDFPDIKLLVDQYALGKCCALDEELLYKAIKEIEQTEIKKNDINLYPLSWQYQAEELLKGYNKLLLI
ncbi:hypothetical protein M3J57_29710, partial [Klebsiella pneumoniae]|nr:hypothetical protein [Klebsiella pneumoniae]